MSFPSTPIPHDERRPLLADDNEIPNLTQSHDSANSESIDTIEAIKSGIQDTSTVLSEVAILAKSSVPLVFAYLLQYSLTIVTMVVAGRLGPLETASVSLAVMTSNITGIGIYEGLAAGLDTLCAQAYGSGRRDMVGVHVQRMIHLMSLCTIPINLAWVLSPQWLKWLVSDPALAVRAGEVMTILSIGNPGYLSFEAGRRFVQAQGLFDAPLYVMLLALPTNVFFSWLLVYKLQWGLNGAALALSITRTLFPVYLVAYTLLVKPSSIECWSGLESFNPRNWTRLVRLGIPGVAIVLAEVFILHFLTVAGTYLSTEEAAAQSVMTTICIVLAHVPLAAGIAVATRIGHLVGSEALNSAKLTMVVSIGLSLMVGALDGALLILLREPIIKALTKDVEVAHFVRSALPALAAFLIPEHATGVINGLLRGLGKQGRGAWINFMLFIIVGIPAALYLCFGPLRLKLIGLWIGAIIAYFVISVTIGVYGLTSDLQKVAAKIRMSESGNDAHQPSYPTAGPDFQDHEATEEMC